MNPKTPALLLASLTLLTITGCSQQLHNMRESRLANGPKPEAYDVKPSVRSVDLSIDQHGHISADSSAAANQLLNQQGALRNQHLLIIPGTDAELPNAHKIAEQLARSGALTSQLQVLQPADDGLGEGQVQLISRALVVDIPDCRNDSEQWTVNPYAAFNNLGCANRANIARMVSDPTDLARPQVLAPADGAHAREAITRYRENDTTELLDIDFSNDN